MTTPYHAKYWAHSLLLAHPRDGVEALSRSIGNARVDLNPHQVDAALFALRSPYSKGVLLADEVGLGKTIEAALILAQKWAERRRRILLIVPATLRKQWQVELEDKFFLPSIILEAKAANDLQRKGVANPFLAQDKIVICSYQFVYTKRELVEKVGWDLVVIDEAHRLRSYYKGTKTAEGIVDSLGKARKLLLTATPLQNSLLELYSLISIVDPELFGSQEAFQAQFMTDDEPEQRDAALRDRIKHVCKRTLRRQVLEYIPFTNRFAHTADFIPSPAEQQLYDEVSAYLQREVLVALPNTRRKLITLIMRKLLASSPAAIGATLTKIAQRLSGQAAAKVLPALEETLAEDFESLHEIDEEWQEDDASTDVCASPAGAPKGASSTASDAQKFDAEVSDLQRFAAMAKAVERDSKATKLVEVLPLVFEKAQEKGAARKAVLFTESCKTQEYLFKLLTENGYAGEIVLMNGSNNDEVSKRTYAEWKKRNAQRWGDVSSGSKSADMKAAIVDEFRERGTLLLATESAAEGVNLQFCSIVINYDLPWNPQRIEQRIGRCGMSGWLEVSKLAAEAIGRSQEYLLVGGCTESGERLPEDVAAKLFSLHGEIVSDIKQGVFEPPAEMHTIRDELRGSRLAELETRNEDFFQEEAEKLAQRSEDLKLGLEREIKRLDKDITAQQREARMAKGLQEKLDAQKGLRALEDRRGAKRRQHFDEHERIKADHDALIDALQRQLRERKNNVETILTLRWTLSAATAS